MKPAYERRGTITWYKGVRMRSKLETRWARLFDQLGWPWSYEQVVTDGYIPDFAVGSGLLLEVKPERKPGDLATYVPKITRGLNSIGYRNPFVILGGDPDLYTGRGFVCPGMYLMRYSGETWFYTYAAWVKCLGCGGYAITGYRVGGPFKPCNCLDQQYEVIPAGSFAHARVKSAFKGPKRKR